MPTTDNLCLTIAELNKLDPCGPAGRRVRALLHKLNGDAAHCFTAAEAKAAGCTLDDLVWAASSVARNDPEVERRLRHWLADCAVRVLHMYERDHPNDGRPRDAILAARLYADGKISDAARAAAKDAAWAAEWAAARDAEWAAARAAARAAAKDAAWAAEWAAAMAAASDAASDAEERFQFDRLVLWLSATPPKPLRMPARVTKKAA